MSEQLGLTGVEVPAIGDDLDFWETPAWATRAILPYIPNDRRWSLIEPCAGRGAMIEPLLELQPESVCAVEVHAGRFGQLWTRWSWLFTPVHGDCLTLDWRAEFLETNPGASVPEIYNLPLAFIVALVVNVVVSLICPSRRAAADTA